MGSGPGPGLPPLPLTWPPAHSQSHLADGQNCPSRGLCAPGDPDGRREGDRSGVKPSPLRLALPLPLPNKGNSSPDNTGVGGGRVLREVGGEGLRGWPWAGGGGGARLSLLCPPPEVKAKVIPQPLRGWAGRGGGSGQTKNWSPGELGAGGEHLGPRQSRLGGGQQAPLWPWPHTLTALPPICTNPCGSQSHMEPLSVGRIVGVEGKLRPSEGRQSQGWGPG